MEYDDGRKTMPVAEVEEPETPEGEEAEEDGLPDVTDLDEAMEVSGEEAEDFFSGHKDFFELGEDEKLVLREQAKTIVENIGVGFWSLGEVLYRIYGSRAYISYGWETFKEFCEMELGYKSRRCEYLMSLHVCLTQKLTSEEFRSRLKALGWTKASRLAPYLTEDNAEKMLKDVEGLTVGEVESYIKERSPKKPKEATDEEHPPKEMEPGDHPVPPMEFNLALDQYRNVQTALAIAQEITGSDKKSHQLDMIALEFVSDHAASSEAKTEIIAKHLAALKGLTGVSYEPSMTMEMLEGVIESSLGNPDIVREKINSTVRGPLTLKEFVIFLRSGALSEMVAPEPEPEEDTVPAPDPPDDFEVVPEPEPAPEPEPEVDESEIPSEADFIKAGEDTDETDEGETDETDETDVEPAE